MLKAFQMQDFKDSDNITDIKLFFEFKNEGESGKTLVFMRILDALNYRYESQNTLYLCFVVFLTHVCGLFSQQSD